MQFQCARCQSKYRISDDKVQGRTIRVRCKSCGAIVVVRQPNEAAKTPVRAPNSTTTPVPSPRSAPQAPGTGAEWYVSLQRSKHGPITAEAVAELLANGELTERSYAWKKGMADWQRIEAISTFNSTLSSSTPQALTGVSAQGAQGAAENRASEIDPLANTDKRVNTESDSTVLTPASSEIASPQSPPPPPTATTETDETPQGTVKQ